MKRQLDRLKGKRLVTGDPNLMAKDEICINATPNGVEVKEIGTDGKIKDLAGSGEESSSFKYESAKIIWKINYDNTTSSLLQQLFQVLSLIPIYAVYSGYIDAGSSYSDKMYGISSSFMLGVSYAALYNYDSKLDKYIIHYIEEAKGSFTVILGTETVTFNNLREFFDMIKLSPESLGLEEIPYEEFNPRINNEIGNFLN